MRVSVLWVALFLWALLMLCWGVLSVFFQATLQRFMDWYTLADTWSKQKAAPKAHGSLSQRVGGVLVMLMGGWMVFELVHLARRGPKPTPPARAVPMAPAELHWSALVAGIVTITLGIYAIIRPQALLRMTQANFPNRELSKETVARSRQGARVLGVLTIAFGAFLLFLWYGWTH
ncbi:MAG: hypothetical protein M1319_03590 [Chloroflexi bacterium]|nr:hypothetical protein [Chloroflexota bacterium]